MNKKNVTNPFDQIAGWASSGHENMTYAPSLVFTVIRVDDLGNNKIIAANMIGLAIIGAMKAMDRNKFPAPEYVKPGIAIEDILEDQYGWDHGKMCGWLNRPPRRREVINPIILKYGGKPSIDPDLSYNLHHLQYKVFSDCSYEEFSAFLWECSELYFKDQPELLK